MKQVGKDTLLRGFVPQYPVCNDFIATIQLVWYRTCCEFVEGSVFDDEVQYMSAYEKFLGKGINVEIKGMLHLETDTSY